ncbi:MAG: phage baseplate assembly protein V [Dehalobacter sp.]|nr:phage baseplate assembly protein V [Dehalobacter sp.]
MNLGELFGEGNEGEAKNIQGVAIGIVTNNQDPEKRGRVKVNLPWRGESDESHWARVSSPMAGNGRGMVFYPEVNDEVLVAFEQGDVNHPYIIGALWNSQDLPPENNSSGKNNIRKIKSRSGHELTFDDTPQQEKIEIKTKGGHMIVLDDSSGQEKIEIADKTGNNRITIDSVKNSIVMECSMQLTIKANIIEIEGTSSLSLKSNALLTIQGLPVKIN